MKKYTFRRYNKKFPELYKREKTKLRGILPKAKIEHIGSTAVPSLGGKGIIDVMIAVPKKKIRKTKEELQKAGYLFKKKTGQDRLFFEKDYEYKGKIRRVHIQLTYKDSYNWKTAIATRDYLRKNKYFLKEYSKIKKEAVKFAKGEGKKYREYKKKFLDKINKKP